MKDRNVVVTGGAGFIGSNLARTLAEQNNVVVVDDLSTGHLGNIKDLIDTRRIVFINGNVTDLELLPKIFKNIDYVFHQAAIASVLSSIKDPISTNNVNINGTLNVLVAARDSNVKKVIYASSCAVYGNTSKIPIKEKNLPDPLSPYAISKLVGEYYCKVFTEVYNLATASLRYFNVYGPRQDPSNEYAAVIPKFINRILNRKSPVISGDGKQTRDFIFVKDIVKANIFVAENKITGIFNVATGNSIQINNLAELLVKMIGKHVEIIYDDPQPGEVKYSSADISRLKSYGYKADYNLEKGLKETIEWFSK